MLITQAQRATNCALIIDPSHDYDLGRYRDRTHYEWPRGPRARIGYPAEYRGALNALGLDLPKRWPSLPRCVVVTHQIGAMIGRALIPERFPGTDLHEWVADYQDEFGLWRAKQLAKKDPYILIDPFRLAGAP